MLTKTIEDQPIEIEELKARYFEALQNIANLHITNLPQATREDKLVGAVIEAVGELEQRLPDLALATLKRALRRTKP